MAKRAKKRKYSKSASKEVENEMRRYKRGSAKSGRGGKGGKVKSRSAARSPGECRRTTDLDVIARAGGPNSPGSDVWVMLEWHRTSAISSISTFVQAPATSVLTSFRKTRSTCTASHSFLAFGALSAQQQQDSVRDLAYRPLQGGRKIGRSAQESSRPAT